MNKLIFLLKKPSVIVVSGNGRFLAKEAILKVLSSHFRIGNEILVFEVGDKEIKKFGFFLKNSPRAILVVTPVGDIPYDKEFFGGAKEEVKEVTLLAKTLPAQANLILNFDDETVREINDVTNLKTLTFGFGERADLRASDVRLNPVRNLEDKRDNNIESLKKQFEVSNGVNEGTNFKVNYKGNIVPVWLEKLFGKEQIYAALSAVAVGTIFDLNLVEMSQSLKNCSFE